MIQNATLKQKTPRLVDGASTFTRWWNYRSPSLKPASSWLRSRGRPSSGSQRCVVSELPGSAGCAPPSLPKAQRVASHARPQASSRSRGTASQKLDSTLVSLHLLLSQRLVTKRSPDRHTSIKTCSMQQCDDIRRAHFGHKRTDFCVYLEHISQKYPLLLQLNAQIQRYGITDRGHFTAIR